LEALERALYEIEAKNFFEAENILKNVISNDDMSLDVKLDAYEVLIEFKINLKELFEDELNNCVNLFEKNNRTDQAITYLKSLYLKTNEIFILDICDELAFKFGHIGELFDLKLRKCAYFYQNKCSNRLNLELLVCSKLFKDEILFKEYQILNSLLVKQAAEFRVLFRSFFKEYFLKTSLSKNDEKRQILNGIIIQAKETFYKDDSLMMELFLIEVESELVRPDSIKIIKYIIKLLLIFPEDEFICQLALMCLDRIDSNVRFDLYGYLKNIKNFNYLREVKTNIRLRDILAKINKEQEKQEPYVQTNTRIKVKFISEDSLLIQTDNKAKVPVFNRSRIIKDLFEKIGTLDSQTSTHHLEFELIEKLKVEEGIVELAYDLIILFLEMQFYEVAHYLLTIYEGEEKEYLSIEYLMRSDKYFKAIDLINDYLTAGNLTPDELVLYKYLKAESFYKLKNYKAALKEFNYIKTVEPGYRLVNERINEIKKN
jgi:hypothetical protein